MNRRSLLKWGLAVPIMSGTPALVWRLASQVSKSRSPKELLNDLMASLGGVERVGVHARRQMRSEDAPELESAPLTRLFPGGQPPLLRMEEFVAQIAKIVRDDFARGDIVRVAEWDLSQTEATILALSAVRHRIDTLGAIPDEDPLARATSLTFLRIKDWGPRQAALGQAFNPQNETRSGIWFLAEEVPASPEVYFAGEHVPMSVEADSFTIGLDDPFRARILCQAGRYQIVALDPFGNRKLVIGEIVVRSPGSD